MAIRRWILVAMVLLAGCEPGLGPDTHAGIDRGREAAEAWIVRASESGQTPASTAIALGYLERLRLGLGSPFRLADQALQDPRLDPSTRADLAWAIVARTWDRDAYRLDPAALVGLSAFQGDATTAALHLSLMEEAVRGTSGPRAGERAIRMAYTRAADQGVVATDAPRLAARAAALLRDRELARTDVFLLLEAAGQTGEDPLDLIGPWRAGLRFAAEAPAMAPLVREVPSQAEDHATRLLEAVYEIEAGRPAGGARPAGLGESARPLLDLRAARRLADLSAETDPPPQAPVAVAVAAARRALLAGRPDLDERARACRERFLAAATSEERFAAEYALLRHMGPGDAAAAIGLDVAVALRAYAQEPVWHPGHPGLSSEQLEERFGLEAVRFGDRVPEAWRSYYRQMVGRALADLERVLPALDLTGLTIVVADDLTRNGALALHDPRRRRIVLPPATGAGAIAHEVAHDLDWQIALHRYGVRGAYASDRAARAPGDPLALRFNELAVAALEGPAREGHHGHSSHSRRPTEVFARSIDWFVAASLAAQGRSNGYLTSIQDVMLTGYGTARPSDATGAAGEALMALLDEIAPVHPAARTWFLASYGRGQTGATRVTNR